MEILLLHPTSLKVVTQLLVSGSHYIQLAVLHALSSLLFLSCSSPVTCGKWIPALTVFDEGSAVVEDYIATYDTKTSSVKYLAFERLSTFQGYSSHSLDVVPSVSNPKVPSHLTINHRRPAQVLGKYIGTNSTVEIFKTKPRGNTLTHVLRAIEDPVIDTPNNLISSPMGKASMLPTTMV